MLANTKEFALETAGGILKWVPQLAVDRSSGVLVQLLVVVDVPQVGVGNRRGYPTLLLERYLGFSWQSGEYLSSWSQRGTTSS